MVWIDWIVHIERSAHPHLLVRHPGIGSIDYLMYAINQGLPRPLAEEIIALTLTTVAVSIVIHGISVTPLMNLYARRKAKHSSR